MSRPTTPSSDEFRDDLNNDQLTFENEQARQQRRRQAGLQRGLSERMEGHTTPLSVGVGRSPFQSPYVTPDTLRRAMESAGVPTAPPAGVGVVPNVSSPSSGVPTVTAIRAAAQDLPLPTFSPRQIDVMERILRGDVPEDQIDALLDSVGLDNKQLTDYMAERSPAPPLPPPPAPRGTPRGRGRPPPRGRGRGRGRGGVLPGGGGGDDDDGSPPGGGGGRRGRGRGHGTPLRRARMNQDELRRQMDLLAEDARQRSVGRRIAGIAHTNTITTVYKDGGEPEVYRTSSRLSTPNTV